MNEHIYTLDITATEHEAMLEAFNQRLRFLVNDNNQNQHTAEIATLENLIAVCKNPID